VNIWAAVEPASAIIAASIPVLRVFVREKSLGYRLDWKKSSGDGEVKAGGLLLALKHASKMSINALSGSQRNYTTQVTAKDADDDKSDRSVLRDFQGIPPLGIMRTDTFVIEYWEKPTGKTVEPMPKVSHEDV
jgi:hypothetical protein